MPKKKSNILWYAMAVVVLIAILSPSTIPSFLSKLSVVGETQNYFSWSCTRSGDSVSCSSGTQLAKYGCSQSYSASRFGFCATSNIQGMPAEIQNILSETGILTDAEKQAFYNSLTFSGDCRLAYQNGLEKNSEGTCGSPVYSGTSQSYSGLSCTKELGACKGVTVPDSCGGSSTHDVQMTLFLGSYHTSPYSDVNDLGSCSITGTLPKKMAAAIPPVNNTIVCSDGSVIPSTSSCPANTTATIPAIPANNTTTYWTCPNGYTLVQATHPYCIPNPASPTDSVACQEPSAFQKCQADNKMYRIIYKLDLNSGVCKGSYDWYNCVYTAPSLIQPSQSSSAAYPVQNLGSPVNQNNNNLIYLAGVILLVAGFGYYILKKRK